jgi:MoxR-like ATPase
MEQIQNQSSEDVGAEPINFHEVSERRKDIRKAALELGGNGAIFDKHYKKPLQEVNEEAGIFKMENFGGFSGAKKALKKQKAEYEENVTERSHSEYEEIFETSPDVEEALKIMNDIADLKNFRMRRMFEILGGRTSPETKKRNESVLKTVKEEIAGLEEKLKNMGSSVLRQAELIQYKENLNESGHICITPSVRKDMEAIGDRMLTGKPMFLHGPTGTGKTSLAKFATTHFAGHEPEMVYCNPQTRESNVWGKTGIRPAKAKKGEGAGAIETVEIYGPLARAMAEGKAIIFDEFTALPKEQMVFIKGIFNAKPGDRINIVGNGTVEVKDGFQMIFTANLKSEKNPERQDLPPEIAREFEQNNLEVKYTPPEESYDIMLSRLLERDGSLNMSFYDLNTTLPNLCKVMAEIQESYTNKTDENVARSAGAMDASGKVHSLKKFVMTQGSVEAILSSYLIEKRIGEKERSFSEFLDERFKTALTFKEYSKEDRILAAKILASKGFLLTLSASDLDLPEEVFQMNAVKTMRGKEAAKELKEKSGAVKHLSLKEVADLDPFGRRAKSLQSRADALLGEDGGEKDPALDDFKKRLDKIYGKEKKPGNAKISVIYTYPGGAYGSEGIHIDLESKLQEFLSLYQKTKLSIPPDFPDIVRDIWYRNYSEMERAIEENGFNEVLILPANIPLTELKEKMEMENGYYEGTNFQAGGSFAQAISQNADRPRIVLVHSAQNLKDREELKKTLDILGSDVNLGEALSLEDYLVFQKSYFEKTGKHLDEDGWTWLATKSGACLVNSGWCSGDRKLYVGAGVLVYRVGDLGVRPSRCFF